MLLILFFTSIQVLLFCREADATITWTAPPPQRGPLQTSDSSVRKTTQQLEINSPEERLKWEFTLSGETLDRVTWEKDNVAIGRKTSSGIIVIEPTENFQEHFGISASDPATLIIKNVTKADAAVFRCSVQTDVKTWVDEIQVEIVVPAKLLNNVSGNQSVSESSDLQLYCGASGNPAPNITWIRVFTNGSDSQVLHRIPTWNITNISRTDAGTYRCTASNGVGDAVSHPLTVNVLYRPKIVNLPSVYNVSVQQSVTLQCEAEGNPTPSFAWTPCKDRCDESTLVIPEVFNDTVYTCTVNNSLGSDFRTASIVIAGKEINVTMTITGESCTNKQLNKTLLSNKLTKEIDKAFVNKSVYNSTTLKDVRCGSLIVDLTLKFNSIVSETWVLSILKEATKDGKLGEFNVAASSIKGTRPVISTTTAPPNGKTTLRSSDGPNIGLIVGCAVGGFIALVIIIAVVIWCVRKNSNKDKDKKRKSKTSNKEAAVTAFTSTPSQPSTAIETRDITLVWDYTLDGTVLKATFSNVTDGINEEIARKVQGGSTVVKNNYKDRFRAGVSDNHAWLKILRVQMSDQGEYQFSLNASGSGTITNVVKVVVQSAANSITWYEPPPVQTTTDTKLIQTHDIQLLGGSTNVKLSWNFTLGRNLNVDALQIFLGRDVVASIFPPGQPTVLDAFSDRFSISWINSQKVTLVIFRVTAFNNGEFSCKVTTGRGRKVWTRKIKVNVVDPPTVITQQCSTPINEGDSVTLYCNATGNPAPNITWIRTNTEEVLSNKKAYIITAIKRNESGSYKCLALNGIGKNSTKSCTVDVQYHPKIMLSADYNVAVHQSVTLHCRAEGNPPPRFLWSPCDPQENVCDESTLIISQVLNDGVYTCTVTNILGSDSANTSVVIAGTEINVTLVITSESCIVGKWYKSLMLSKNLNEAISLIFVNESAYRRTIVMDVRCGSFIVDLVLKFSSTVTEKWVLNMLRRAIKNGKLGEFSINTSSIIGTRVFIQRTTMPSISSKTTPSLSNDEVCGDRGCSCNCNVLIVLVSILAAIIILLIVFIIWLLKKGTTGRGRSYAESAGNNNNAIEMEVRQPDRIPSWPQTTEVPSRSQYMVLDDARRSNDLPEVTSRTDTSQTSQYAPLHPSTLSREIPRENVTIEKIIGKGAFSQVAKGRVIGLRGRAQMTLVAVKMLKANAPVSDKKDLLSELEVMKTLKPHPHVIKLLGYVTESEPLLVLIEYVPYGDLLGYLRKSRGLNDTYYQDPDIKPQTSLTSQQLMKFAWQIADGMSYLSSRSIIHRDLAARNVLVGEKETCKVTDFGMARDVRQENIYERKTKGRLPVKWTAYESLMYGTYTTKSDVWSYGVLLYEICTIGGSPYPRMDMANIASLLHQGYRMPKPQHVDEELYKIMTTCWEENPDVRPTFAELRNKLKKMENRHKRLINMKMYDTQLYANVEDLVM